MQGHLFVITVLGKDRKGLVSDITNILAKSNTNIIDIEQSLIHGLFSMFMLIDISDSNISLSDLRIEFSHLSERNEVNITISDFSGYSNDSERNIQRIILFGRDRPGIVSGVSEALSSINLNIEHMRMISRGDLIAMELSVDSKCVPLSSLRDIMRKTGESINIDIIVQPNYKPRQRKRLVVFDMDGTVIDQEITDELAKSAGVADEVMKITAMGMKGEMDFEKSLRKRVHMLKGLSEDQMREIRDNMRLNPGIEDLIVTLKNMGYVLALVSGGFTYFTESLKNRLGFDYAFGNELVLKDGKLTGELKGAIIDSDRKASLMNEIALKENIYPEDVVAVGDGANDRVMLEQAGLGIAFNAKEVLKKVADGSITKENLKGLLYCMGLTEKDLGKIYL